MNRGAVLFAFNSPSFDYFNVAKIAARRINHFLNLPVTIITDQESYIKGYKFDKVIFTNPNKNNKRDIGDWYNKGRYKVFELSPYDETLLLDTDYIVNSDKLNMLFDYPTDFCCHKNASILMQPSIPQEYLSEHSFQSLWATVIYFKKTKRTKYIFELVKMIENNYQYYASLHKFVHVPFRNDFALALALRIVNGHIDDIADIIPWNLLHTGRNTKIYKVNDYEFDTEFCIIYDNWQKGKLKKDYIILKDTDFHVIVKDSFSEWIK